MAAASPHRPQPPKPLLDLDVTVISAKHLKNVNWRNGDLKPYAVAYLDPDRRSATKPDDSGSTRPVWNERLTLPLPFDSNDVYSQTLTLDIFHSRPSETPKPLVGTVRVPFKDLVADLDDSSSFAAGSAPIKTLELRRPSGRPQGKVRIKIAVRERPLPPPPPPPEQNFQIPPPPPSGYYYSTAPPSAVAPMPQHPPPQARDYRTFSQPPPVAHYSSTVPSRQSQYSFPGSDDASYYDPYYYSSGAAYYSPAPVQARPVYYDRPGPASYGGPSAPVDYTPSYEQKTKGPRMGMGAGLAVGAVAGALGGLALEEGVKYEDEENGRVGRGGSIFKVPEALIPPTGARVMSLTDGLSKMSKSAPSDQSRINLLDPKDVIANKVKRCKTDAFAGLEFDNPERPECNNLLTVYQLVTGKIKEEVALECQDMNWGTFKPILTDALVSHLDPIQTRYGEITSDPAYLDKVLSDGATKAAEIADTTLNNVYQAMGFLRR